MKAQEWLTESYKDESSAKEIVVPYELELTGDLEISDFPNLEKFKFASKENSRRLERLGIILGEESAISKKNIAKLKVNNCPKLTEVNLRLGKIKETYLENCPLLKEVDLEKSKVSKLEIKNCSNIILLDAKDCNLSELDVSALTKLEQISVRNNQLTELDLSNNSKLNWLILADNPWNKYPLEAFSQQKKELFQLKEKLANIEKDAQALQGDNNFSSQAVLYQLAESKNKLQEYETKEQEYQKRFLN